MCKYVEHAEFVNYEEYVKYTKFAKQSYQTKPTKPNLPNQTYWSKQSTPGPVVPLAMFADCLTGSIFQKAKLKGNLGWLMGIFCRKT